MDVTAFAEHQHHLHGVAYRMLGSASEADDAVQEAWLRFERADRTAIENLRGWLTTVVARICLDMLRSRKDRREEPIDPTAKPELSPDASHEIALADAVGLALLVVLETLAPAERLAFVLHDLFALPFDEIADIVGKSPDATRQLASRVRRRIQGAPAVPEADLRRQREVIGAFLTAMRAGDLEGLIAVLDPDVAVQTDQGNAVVGARTWAKGAIAFRRFAEHISLMLVDGEVGLVLAPRGHLARVLRLNVVGDRIATVQIIIAPEALAKLELSMLPERDTAE